MGDLMFSLPPFRHVQQNTFVICERVPSVHASCLHDTTREEHLPRKVYSRDGVSGTTQVLATRPLWSGVIAVRLGVTRP